MNPELEKFQIKELEENGSFDPSSFCVETPFTQAGFYGNWQESLGRKVKKYIVTDNSETVAYFHIIKYTLMLSKSYLYIPYGPVLKNQSENLLLFIKEEIKKINKKENAIFTRLDFTPFIPNEILEKHFTKSPLYTYHSAYFQPRTEWVLNLKKTETELLAGIHKNHRYSIRVAEKEKITVEIITTNFEKYFETFYELMNGTAKRNGFNLHPKKYYQNIFQNLSKTNSYLAVARLDEKILVIDLVIIYNQMANYVFSGSSNEERNKMPAYLALWKTICYARELNCQYFNFGGISTGDKIYKGWDGLTAFKKKFGGQELKHSYFFDLVSNPFWYHLYNFRKLLKKIIS